MLATGNRIAGTAVPLSTRQTRPFVMLESGDSPEQRAVSSDQNGVLCAAAVAKADDSSSASETASVSAYALGRGRKRARPARRRPERPHRRPHAPRGESVVYRNRIQTARGRRSGASAESHLLTSQRRNDRRRARRHRIGRPAVQERPQPGTCFFPHGVDSAPESRRFPPSAGRAAAA
jgi:hypothetical protein